MSEVIILDRRIRRRRWSSILQRKLRRRGVDAVMATIDRYPAADLDDCEVLVNYGCSLAPVWWDELPSHCRVFNTPAQVAVSADKIKMMKKFMETIPGHHLEFYTDKADAQAALDSGKTIVARGLIRSHSGRGIQLCPPSTLPDARLYTVLKRASGLREYRVFLWDGKAIAVVQKKRKGRDKLLEMAPPHEVETWWESRIRQVVRSWNNGWAFITRSLDVPADDPVFSTIAESVAPLLGWGCVDVLVGTRTKNWWVVEINSAPGLRSETTQELFMECIENELGR